MIVTVNTDEEINSAEIDAIMADIKATLRLHPDKRLYKHQFSTPDRNQGDVDMAWLLLQLDGILPKGEPTLDIFCEMK